MSFTIRFTGNILHSKCEYIVNPVNCAGVMGAGLAKQFKETYPKDYYLNYKQQCETGILVPGKITIWKSTSPLPSVINFPSKYHWHEKSNIKMIEDGLDNLVEHFKSQKTSIAIPLLGAGLGGLDKQLVAETIADKIDCLTSNCEIELYFM